MWGSLIIILVALTMPAGGVQADKDAADPWASWKFFIGEWTGEGGGKPGEAVGGFSFKFDLGQKILVRKNRADYPAMDTRPAFTHEDLMMTYPDPAGGPTRAIYFDNEGHVINYAAEFSGDNQILTFLSENLASTPRYRFTYIITGKDSLRMKFEIAPPGKPNDFRVYVEARARRNQGR